MVEPEDSRDAVRLFLAWARTDANALRVEVALDYVLAAAESDAFIGLASLLARRAGVHERTAERVVQGLSSRLTARAIQALRSLPDAARAPRVRELRDERERARRSRRRSGRGDPPTTRESVEAARARAHELQTAGELDAAAAILNGSGLDYSSITRAVRRGDGRALASSVEVLRADIAMNRGLVTEAVTRTRRLLSRASKLPPDIAVWSAVALGAAERMRGAERWSYSMAAYGEAVRLAEARLDGAERRRALRWVLAAMSTPGLLLNDFKMESTLLRSLDLAKGPSEEGETRLLLARSYILSRRFDEAEQHIARVRDLASQVPQWLRGWTERYEFDLLVRVFPEDCDPREEQGIVKGARRSEALRMLIAAWRTNRTQGFQLRVLLARFAACRVRYGELRELSMPLDITAAVNAEIARCHQRIGRVSDCPSCRSAELFERIIHALALEESLSRRNCR